MYKNIHKSVHKLQNTDKNLHGHQQENGHWCNSNAEIMEQKKLINYSYMHQIDESQKQNVNQKNQYSITPFT